MEAWASQAADISGGLMVYIASSPRVEAWASQAADIPVFIASAPRREA